MSVFVFDRRVLTHSDPGIEVGGGTLDDRVLPPFRM
jgi:hypothetical protein